MRKRIYFAAVLALVMVVFTSCFKEDPDVMTGLIGYYSFDNSDGTDQSGNGHTGTFAGKTSPSFVDGIKGKAFHIEGENNTALEIPYLFFKDLDEWSISFWAKDFGGGYGTLFSQLDPQSDGVISDIPRVFVYTNNQIMGIQLMHNDNYGFGYDVTNSNGKWEHYVVVLDSLETNYSKTTVRVKVYVNGKKIKSFHTKYEREYMDRCSKTVFGGKKKLYDITSIDAKLDEIRIYNRALNAWDIKALYDLEY